MDPDEIIADGPFRNRPANARGIRIATVRFGAVFWILLFVLGSAYMYAIEEFTVYAVVFRMADLVTILLLAMALAHLLYLLHDRSTRRRTSEDSLPILFIAALALSFAAAVFWAWLHNFYPALVGLNHPQPLPMDNFAIHLAIGWGFLFGWACLFQLLMFGFELNDRKLRLAAIREEALDAQMRALRYQINPHFLFNTLNSIGGLIEEGATPQAQRMVLSLSTFLRTTLALDPFQDVPLADEIALQNDYLGIERERFSDRMSCAITLEPDAACAMVPSLILQPLVENAIKHGVGKSRNRIAVSLRARRVQDRLLIEIENDLPRDPPLVLTPPGGGIGLANVEKRLRARFQSNFAFDHGCVAGDRYRVAISVPWRAA